MKTDKLLKLIQQKNVMRSGGALPLPKAQTGTPTFADSLALYNNALDKIKFYSNNPDYRRINYGYTNFSDDSTRKNLINALGRIENQDKTITRKLIDQMISAAEDPANHNQKPITATEKEQMQNKLGETRFGKVPNTGLYSYGDILSGKPDRYYNPLAPPIYLHPNIKPHGSETYSSGRFQDTSEVPYYEPLLVKPESLLTPGEIPKRNELLLKLKKQGKLLPDQESKNSTDTIRSLDIPFMKMKGMPEFSQEQATPQKVQVPQYTNLPPQYMDMRGEWADTPPTAYPYTREQLLKMGYRQDGGNTYVKAQAGISQDATRVVKPLIQPLLLNQKLPPFITEQQRKSPTVFIKDTRKTHPVTGQPINPNRDLKTGNYNKAVFEAIIEEAKKLGFNKQQVLDNLLITGQESTWGTTDLELGHALHADYISGTVDGKQVFPPLSETQFQFYEEDPYAKHARAQLMNYYYNAYVLNKPSPKTSMEQRLQFYNTPYPKKGQVTKDTEKNYYKGTNKRFYGVDVTKQPLSMASNPYGKTVASFYPMVANNPEIQYLLYQHGYKKQGGLTKAQTGQQTGWAYDETSNSYLPEFSLPEVQVTAERPGLFKQMRKKFMDSYNPLLPATAQPGLFMEALGVPQQALMYGLTGQYARPSEIYPTKGIGSFGNKFNDFMFDVVTDPLAYLAEASQLRGALRGAKKAPTSLDDFADDLFDEDLFSKEIEATVKQMERDKLRSRLQDLSGRSKVPDEYMIEARGLAAEEPILSSKDFYTPDEITANAKQWRDYWDARDKYDEMNPENPGSIIMSALTGDKSRMESFETLFPNAKLPNWREKLYQPEHLKELRESLPYDDQFRWNDPLAPKGGLKSFQQKISSSKEVPGTVNDYLRRINDTWHLNDPRGYVSEMRGSAGLSLADIKNLSDDELKSVAETIHSKMLKQHQERMMNDIFRSSSATPSLRGFRPGQMNKMGGLTKHQSKGVVNDERGSLNNMNVSEIWKLVTGSDWSQAKKLGLTDGSYDKNMALRSTLLSAIKKNLPPAEKPKVGVAPKPVTQKPKYQVEIPGVQRDATTTRPSDQQRAYEFYSQQPFGLTDPNSRIPKDTQYTMMQTATQPDVVYQTPTGIRSSLQSFYNQLSRSTKNDLANTIIGTVAYPLQAGLNISNAITGDVPITSDSDLSSLGLDALSFLPAAKFARNAKGFATSAQNDISRFFKPLSSGYGKRNITERYLADQTAFPNLEVIKKGSRFKPKTVTIRDITEEDQYLRAVRNKDGSYSFQFDMSKASPRRAGIAMQLLQKQFKPLTQFKETGTLSLDSYKNLVKRLDDPAYSAIPSGRSTLNAQAARARFLDDLADPYVTDWKNFTNKRTADAFIKWDLAGSPMYFSTKNAAAKAAERINLNYFGAKAVGDNIAIPVRGDNRKWTISLPNYKLTKLKKLGGSTKIKIIK